LIIDVKYLNYRSIPNYSVQVSFKYSQHSLAHNHSHARVVATASMNKLEPTKQNLVQIFNSRSGRMPATHFLRSIAKQPNLHLKTRSKQLLGYLPFDILLGAGSQQLEDKGLTSFPTLLWLGFHKTLTIMLRFFS
jgi:hypothetical protein